jgi:hypothetical protein
MALAVEMGHGDGDMAATYFARPTWSRTPQKEQD